MGGGADRLSVARRGRLACAGGRAAAPVDKRERAGCCCWRWPRCCCAAASGSRLPARRRGRGRPRRAGPVGRSSWTRPGDDDDRLPPPAPAAPRPGGAVRRFPVAAERIQDGGRPAVPRCRSPARCCRCSIRRRRCCPTTAASAFEGCRARAGDADPAGREACATRVSRSRLKRSRTGLPRFAAAAGFGLRASTAPIIRRRRRCWRFTPRLAAAMTAWCGLPTDLRRPLGSARPGRAAVALVAAARHAAGPAARNLPGDPAAARPARPARKRRRARPGGCCCCAARGGRWSSSGWPARCSTPDRRCRAAAPCCW